MPQDEIESDFPGLAASKYSITSPPDVGYNCIAWAAGDPARWWWPDRQYQYYWPRTVPRICSIESFVAAFRTMGYGSCESPEVEPGVEKIAVFADAAQKPKHAARQLQNGRWTSKLGGLEDIEHELEALQGSDYGTVAKILSRPAYGVTRT